MEKKLKVISIIIWGIIAITLTGALIFGIVAGGKGNFYRMIVFHSGDRKVQQTKEMSLQDAKKVNVDFSSDDISIYTTDEDDIKVVQKAYGTLKEEEKFTMEKNGDTINIKKGGNHLKFFIFGFGNFGSEVEVYVPKKYSGNLSVESSSGDIIVNDDINLKEVSFSQSSGEFKCNSEIKADKVDLEASSGDIDVNSLIGKSYDINVSSGDIRISSLSGSGNIEASSGDIKVGYKDINDKSDITATSGDVKVNMPKEMSFSFEGKCTSGDIKSNFDLSYSNKKRNQATAKVGSDPYKQLKVDTSSGDINISID
ncbi:DUF4097 family beta strand repeat-containing protein [Clostridium sp. 'White wine YQ']|uniref:DUF4097 family beta strand repeat-containing protein n=1 Tax=Clostridium sp. 'White wine YQ' TaxID=3027474 RepID=UPI002366E932|nr:DUF4097 family beta strand repeat-containing protein [Clostridium sp. 'White wine YQ']MDD7795844.1 DUF4097 family beta strand repeat-containing protein [Clostridium sp. 'White wine YQ']